MAKMKGSKPSPLNVVQNPGEERSAALARTALRPTVNAALTTKTFSNLSGADLDLTALVEELSTLCSATSRGDLSRPEVMLTAQAHSLDAIFNHLSQRAAANIGHYPETVERYMKLALRAQSQCRAAIEALAAIKNPQPTLIAKQANLTSGPQQVNNTFSADEPTRAREIQKEPSKLLEETYGARLDLRSTGEAIGSDSAMATVAAVNRTEDCGR